MKTILCLIACAVLCSLLLFKNFAPSAPQNSEKYFSEETITYLS